MPDVIGREVKFIGFGCYDINRRNGRPPSSMLPHERPCLTLLDVTNCFPYVLILVQSIISTLNPTLVFAEVNLTKLHVFLPSYNYS